MLAAGHRSPDPVVHRLRAVYAKTGAARFISHQDTINAVNRALRRADVPVGFTQGFGPRPRTSFGPALTMFVEATGEMFDCETTGPVEPARFVDAMNEVLPDGLWIVSAAPVDARAPSITASVVEAAYEVGPREQGAEACGGTPSGVFGRLLAGVASFHASPEVLVTHTTKGIQKTVDIKPRTRALAVEGDVVRARVDCTPSRSLNVIDLVKALVPGLTADQVSRLRIVRTGLVLADAAGPAGEPRPAGPAPDGGETPP